MSSSSSLPPPPPTDASSSPQSPGGTPPPPPPSPTNIATANYFFGFIITFVILLLLFVGCGIGSWRRFRLVGTALDERLQDMEGSTFVGRKRGRRRLVRPVFWEQCTYPKATHITLGASDKSKWTDVQPISAAFIWSRSKLKQCTRTRKTEGSAQPDRGQTDGPTQGVTATLWSFIFPRRPHCDHPPKPPPVERPPPEAIQVAVMIAMPTPPQLASNDGPNYVGRPEVGEYQIGVVRIPWS